MYLSYLCTNFYNNFVITILVLLKIVFISIKRNDYIPEANKLRDTEYKSYIKGIIRIF